MNLRDIKKDIEYVLSAFVEDCSICASVNPNASDEKIAALLEKSVALYNELRDKVNVKVEGPKKAYYNSLRKEILEETNALYEELSATVKAAAAPAEEKKAAPAKKAAAEKKPAEKKAPAEKKPAAKKAPAKKEE